MAPWIVKVGPWFSPEYLPPDLDCYFRLPGKMVMAYSEGELALVFLRGEEQLICNCPEYELKQTCRHTQALRAGLWIHIFQCPRGYGVVTCTRDWVRKGQFPAAIRMPLDQEMPIAV